MNKYTKLSDFEINCQVLETFEPNIIHMSLSRDEKSFFHCGYDGNSFYEITIPDYCNNPSDAMPIIIEHDIDLLNGENMMPELFGHHSAYTLHNFNTPISSDSLKEDKTIYRLGMEAFLMKKDAENENNNNS